MARKRMIDPRIWESEQFQSLTYRQKVIYIGLISDADDKGKLKNKPGILKGKICPLDNDITPEDFESDITAIAETGLICCYKINGNNYIHHPNWLLYQSINRPTPSIIPDCNACHDNNNDNSVSTHAQLNANRIEKKRKEVSLKEEKSINKNMFKEENNNYQPNTFLCFDSLNIKEMDLPLIKTNGDDTSITIGDAFFDINESLEWYKKEYQAQYKKPYQIKHTEDYAAIVVIFHGCDYNLGRMKHYLSEYIKMDQGKGGWRRGKRLKEFANHFQRITDEIDDKPGMGHDQTRFRKL